MKKCIVRRRVNDPCFVEDDRGVEISCPIYCLYLPLLKFCFQKSDIAAFSQNGEYILANRIFEILLC